MAKKSKIILDSGDDNLRDIDNALDAALGELDQANQKVSSLLETIEKGEEEDAGAEARVEETGDAAEAETPPADTEKKGD